MTETTTKCPAIIGDCPINIDSAYARLVAADWFEDHGEVRMAYALRQTGHPFFVTRDGGLPLQYTHNQFKSRVAHHKMVKTACKTLKIKKLDLTIVVTEHVQVFNREWDEGGTIHEYSAIWNKGKVWPLRYDDQRNTQASPVLRHGYFLGKQYAPKLYIHPWDAHKFGIVYIQAY